MLKLKLQYFNHLMLRVDSLEKTLMLGKIEGRRRRGRQRMRWLDGITDSMDMSLSKRPGHSEGQRSLRAAVHGVLKSQTRLSNWTTWYKVKAEDFGIRSRKATQNVLEKESVKRDKTLFFFFFWLHWVLVVACRILTAECRLFSCSIWGSSSLTRDRTPDPCTGRVES